MQNITLTKKKLNVHLEEGLTLRCTAEKGKKLTAGHNLLHYNTSAAKKTRQDQVPCDVLLSTDCARYRRQQSTC